MVEPAAYPFTEPASTPHTKPCCLEKKKTISGRIIQMNAAKTGMNVIWSGTTSRLTTMPNNTCRPRVFTQAKAYAAKAATVMGSVVAGMEISWLFRKERTRPSVDRTVA